MTLATEISQEPTVANPLCFRWLKRIGLLAVLVLLALGALRWWWGHAAAVRLQRVIDAAHARGEPILPEDFSPQSVPDGQNAAVTLQQAADAIVTDANSGAMDMPSTSTAFTRLEINRTDAIVANNARALRLVRRARSQPLADWGLNFRKPGAKLPHLSPHRELAKIQKWVALRDHAKGNDAEALEHVSDMLRQSEAFDQGSPVILMHLTALALDDLTTDLLERITPDLKVSTREPRLSKAATPAQVHSVIATLLDEQAVRGGAVRAWELARMLALDDATTAAAWQTAYARPFIARLLGPMFLLDGDRGISDVSKVVTAARLPNLPAAAAALPVPTSANDLSELGLLSHVLSNRSSGWSTHVAQGQFRALAERRAAAIGLALRLYRLDHDGKLPEKLSQLVPDYLPALPADPMAADGRTFGYHPNAQPPVIYSVGYDGVDNGGTSIADEALGQYRWRMADAVYPLELPPPSTQPSATETQDNQ